MNDLNGRILPDTSTGLPSVAHELEANAELNRLRTRLSTLEDENRILKAENAELREKLMTNFERLKDVGTVNEAAEMIYDALWRYVVDIDINYITAWLESRDNT